MQKMNLGGVKSTSLVLGGAMRVKYRIYMDRRKTFAMLRNSANIMLHQK